MQLKAGYGSVHGLPCDEGKSLTWLTCKRAHAGRLDWGLKTSITFVWLSIYQYTDFHFSSPAEFPVHEPQLYVAHLYLWCARCWNTSCSYFLLWYIASLQAACEAGPPDQDFLMLSNLLCEHLIWSWSPSAPHTSNPSIQLLFKLSLSLTLCERTGKLMDKWWPEWSALNYSFRLEYFLFFSTHNYNVRNIPVK